ncbi:MAG: cyclic pyranopterin monophosphate synthase MoaC [Candidatus Kariarchaeaceae archaeon]|jgi:cyclic pyranopterin phosphate synthase
MVSDSDNSDQKKRENPTRGMIEISEKPDMVRTATAMGTIVLSEISMYHIVNKSNPKGDVLENAKLAAILAVKKTPELVFMCHPIKITSVKVDFTLRESEIDVIVTATCIDKTGVEIEAMAGVFNALLAIFDLCKRYEKDEAGQYPVAKITETKVISKEKVMKK